MQDRVIEAEDDAAVRHLAKCFGHIYAAAIIGAGSGTLPWQAKTVRKCIERCYRDARRELNTETDLLRDGLNILRAKMRALPKANGADLKSVDGFRTSGTQLTGQQSVRRRLKNGSRISRQPNLVLKSLRSKNALPSRPVPPTKNGICDRVGRIAADMAGRIAAAFGRNRCSARAVQAAQSVGHPPTITGTGFAEPVSPSQQDYSSWLRIDR